MAEINNFSAITENFDTIKTLLNSIRAQGILNTSDVDKLLAGINSKLEKLNTEEDIDLIKVFLSELKQNLDERHSVLISKFGAIESLFSNLLKNSADSLKSSEVKELFDIVATNLSVFSREVVAQKETLSEITLRLDAMRSDDSQKKDIIKNISVLKNDLEHLNNGFDSIVLSLNENFKTLIKTLSNIDQSEAINKFGAEINDVVASANSILSAIQMLDKKNIQIEDSIKLLATQEDLSATKKWISDLVIQNDKFDESINNLADKFYKIDNLAEKIDASVNIIAGLKSVITDRDDEQTRVILDKLSNLEISLKQATDSKDLDNLKESVLEILNNLKDGTVKLDGSVENLYTELQAISSAIKSLAVDLDPNSVLSSIEELGVKLKDYISLSSDRLSQLIDVNNAKTINSLTTETEKLQNQITVVRTDISDLCLKNFNDLMQDVTNLKDVLSQLDENNVSANNAIFANITDRLAVFENSLKKSLDKQETYVANSANQLFEQISEIKNLSGVIDYKLDASVIETNNSKREFSELKASVDSMLGLDFVNVVKDLRVDLYASKQELGNAVETLSSDLTDKFTNELFSKYELLISRLDAVEDGLKQSQLSSLANIKNTLDSIASSIVDVLSYVSVKNDFDSASYEQKLADIIEIVKDNNLNYIENVRDIVEVIRTQVENNLLQIDSNIELKVTGINNVINKSEEALKEELRYSYNKLLELKDSFSELKDSISEGNAKLVEDLDVVKQSSDLIKSDFEQKLNLIKTSLQERITEFKKEISCENADSLSEIKFVSENIYAKNIENANLTKEEIKASISQVFGSLKLDIEELAQELSSNSVKYENLNRELYTTLKDNFDIALNKFESNINNKEKNIKEKLDVQSKEADNNIKSVITSVQDMSDKVVETVVDSARSTSKEIISVNDLLKDLDSKTISLQQELESLGLLSQKVIENITFESNKTVEKVGELESISNDIGEKASALSSEIVKLDESITNLTDKTTKSLSSTLAQILDNFVAMKALISNLNDATTNKVSSDIENLKNDLLDLAKKLDIVDSNIDEDLTRQLSLIESGFMSFENRIDETFKNVDRSIEDNINSQFVSVSKNLSENISEKLNAYVSQIDKLFENITSSNNENSDFIKNNVVSITARLNDVLEKQNAEIESSLNTILEKLNLTLNDSLSNTAADYESLKAELANFSSSIEIANSNLLSDLKAQFDDVIKFVDSGIEIQAQEVNSKFQQLTSNIDDINRFVSDLKVLTNEKSANIIDNINSASESIKASVANISDKVEDNLSEIFVTEIMGLYDRVSKLADSQTAKISDLLNKEQCEYLESLNSKYTSLKSSLEDFYVKNSESLDKYNNEYLEELKNKFLELDLKLNSLEQFFTDKYSAGISLLSNDFKGVEGSLRDSVSKLEDFLEDRINAILTSSAEISAGELQSIEAFTDRIINQINLVNKTSESCHNVIKDFTKKELELLMENIEKESDLILKDIQNQFIIFRDSQKDEFSRLTIQLESSIEDYIYNHLSDLKSYLDVKTDNTFVNDKLDALKIELSSSVDSIVNSLNKLLETNIFQAGVSDLKATNEILIKSMAETLNDKIQRFIVDNLGRNIEDKLNLFDKKFVDAIVDNYEEIKLILTNHNTSINSLENSMKEFISELNLQMNNVKDEINSKVYSIVGGIDKSIDDLGKRFADLKAQILNKSFDEAFQASLNNQISGIENLVNRQIGYLEDISSLCCDNLPELTEMNTIIKHSILNSVDEIMTKVSTSSEDIDTKLKELKSDIITQFINIFNQISFVAEQEEILDFIQDKHSELITILSHIVTTVDSVDDVKDNVAVVDNKLDSLKEDIDLINEKITSIMSSDGDINYVYSLQDLESDIANLRIILNEMKDNNNSKEFEELLSSTNDIYKLVETLKNELPKFEYDEFKQDFEALTEDIVSISTRTNKLILASDESYKTLQDNLQEFKLVINDLDERTRNFAQEVGMDRIDNKLGAINTMIQNGAKSNQVFNQVFEYLAEWVDKAGEKINTISDRVETLDDIGQIKVMLEDLKAEAEDNSDSVELIEALGNIFDKQVKKISSLEAKLDRVIVETTINNKNKELDLSPFEDTLNRFLVAMDDKMSAQQDRINTLEAKLEEVLSIVDSKETAQLTKKVGGMDRQIAKLNKSIEKIASHVVEK